MQEPDILIQHNAQPRNNNHKETTGDKARVLHPDIDENIQHERDQEKHHHEKIEVIGKRLRIRKNLLEHGTLRSER